MTPDSPVPPTEDVDRLRKRASGAALFCGILFLLGAVLTVIESRSLWSKQVDYAYAYANAGFMSLLLFVALGAVYLMLASLLQRRGDSYAGGAAFITGWGMRIALFLFFCRYFVPPVRLLFLLLAPLLPLGGLILFLAQGWLVRYGRAVASGQWNDRLAQTGAAAPIVFLIVYAMALYPIVSQHRRFDAYAGRQSLWRLHRCVNRYADSSAGRGFPRNDLELSRDPACAPRRIVAEQPSTLRYRAGEADQQGRVTSYQAWMEQRHIWPQRYESLVIDASGIVRRAFRRKATASDHVMGEVSARLYSGCLSMFRSSYGGYPTDISQLKKRRCASAEPLVAPNTFETDGYRLYYQPIDPFGAANEGLARNYMFHLRPIVFGETGVRSYFLDENDVLRSTGADRAANVSDPEVQGCEFEPMGPWRGCNSLLPAKQR